MGLIPYGLGQRAQVTMGGAPAINPLSLPNLELYLNSTLGLSGAHDSAVSTWPNQSSHGTARDGLQDIVAIQPRLQTTSNLSPTGKQLVRFDGLNSPNGDTMDSPTFSVPSPTDGQTFYCWIRARQPARTQFPNFTHLFSDRSTRRNPALYLGGIDEDNKYGMSVNSSIGPGTRYHFDTFAPGVQTIVWVLSPPAASCTVRFFRNGVETGTDALVGSASGFVGGFDLCSANGSLGGNGAVDGDLGAFIWYSVAHSAGIRTGVTAWLQSYFG